MTLKFAALLPGLPHLIAPPPNSPHAKLQRAMQDLGRVAEAEGVERIIYCSSQWLSVLGTMVQAKPRMEGIHVDPSWHDLGSLRYDISVDVAFSERLASAARSGGYVTHTIDYDGFPLDTGTIVADSLFNQAKVKVTMISSWLYADYNRTKDFASTLAVALAQDPVPSAVVGITSLSGNYFATASDPREDHLSSTTDDKWNRRIIDLCERGSFSEVDNLASEYSRTCRVDVDFKVMAFLRGIGAAQEGKKAISHEYQAICGTGAAVIKF